jgi:hypothetical protein
MRRERLATKVPACAHHLQGMAEAHRRAASVSWRVLLFVCVLAPRGAALLWPRGVSPWNKGLAHGAKAPEGGDTLVSWTEPLVVASIAHRPSGWGRTVFGSPPDIEALGAAKTPTPATSTFSDTVPY